MPRRSAAQIGSEFEDYCRRFLAELGFENVNGGNQFRIGEQIDACGGFEETLVIVEATTTTATRKGKPLLDEIKLIRGKASNIGAELKQNPLYSRYKNVKYVLAVNFDARDEDHKEANKQPRVYLWDRSFMDYYKELLSRIGQKALYNLLGEIEIHPSEHKPISLPSFRVVVQSTPHYLFFVSPNELLKWAYVARRELGREKFYQRLVEKRRIAKISDYVNSGHYFPNSVIVAFNVDPTFDPLPIQKVDGLNVPSGLEFGKLSFPRTFRSCWIVDGQHRLYGMSKSAAGDTFIPVVALQNLPIEKQAALFLDINKHQKPVAPDLVWDLEGEMRPTTRDGIVSRIAKRLNERGPMKGRVYIPLSGMKRRGQINLAGLCSAIKKHILSRRVLAQEIGDPLFTNDHDRLVESASHYLSSCLEIVDRDAAQWQKEGFWFGNAGVAILMSIAERILIRTRKVPSDVELTKYFDPAIEHLERYAEPRKLKSLKQRCNSEGGRDEVADEFARAIRRSLGDSQFAEDVPEHSGEQRIKRVERGLAELLARVLGTNDSEWFRHRVPQDIQDRVKEVRKRDRLGSGRIQEYLTLGQIGQIVGRKDNWADLEATLVSDAGFNDREDVQSGFSTINRLRGRIAHGRASLSEADESLLDGFLQKFERAIESNSE